jgi:hypothetical protein
MSRNPDPHSEAGDLTELLQRYYARVEEDLRAIAHSVAQEEVRSIAAQQELELRRVLDDMLGKRQDALPRFSLWPKPRAGKLAVAVVVVGLSFVAVKSVLPWLTGPSDPLETRAQTGNQPPELPAPVAKEPLRVVGAARYDSLFDRRDPALEELLRRGEAGGTALSDTVQLVLQAWRGGLKPTEYQLDLLHGVFLQAALRTRGVDQVALNGRIDRRQCAQDPACTEVIRLWKGDRAPAALRVLDEVPDQGVPAPDELRKVEKFLVYEAVAEAES